MTPFDTVRKTKDFLICIDSDGCAMDTMDIKHIRCFGPCMVEEWGLQAWREPILTRWNEINLYSMTRGINRFRGLARALCEIDAQYTAIPGCAQLLDWAEHAPELSNRAVAALSDTHPIFARALRWSEAVNAAITALPNADKRPFDGVREAITAAHACADVAVVSSANRDAVQEEWERYHLLEHVDCLLCQDAGSKAHCIAELLKKGYAPEHVLMVGDAPGDLAAAEQTGVFYYPILVRHEAESWAAAPDAFAALVSGTYAAGAAQHKQAFLDNLQG